MHPAMFWVGVAFVAAVWVVLGFAWVWARRRDREDEEIERTQANMDTRLRIEGRGR